MSDLPQPAWFVRLDGAISGPITLADLRRLARSRRVVPNTLVSRDSQKWFAASALPALRIDLVDNPIVVPAPPIPLTQRAGMDSRLLRPVWNTAGIVCCIMVLGSCVLCMGFLGTLEETSTNVPGPEIGRTTVPTGSVSHVGESTAMCWLSVQREVAQIPQVKNATGLSVIAGRLERLPVFDVDPDLVEFVLELASLIRESGQLAQREKDPALFLESVVRGSSGDPLETLNDQMRAQKIVLDRWTAMQSYSARLRAVMSQRYGAEFPPFLNGSDARATK